MQGIRIALTGGMGCGKSTAARFFAEAGFLRFDADACVRGLLAEDAEVRAELRARWGEAVFTVDGTVNRAAVAERVFAADEERLWLESRLHPRVRAAWERAWDDAPEGPWAVEVPLLFEKGLEKGFDFVVCVGASSGIQLARLTERGLSRALAGQRLTKQLPLLHKLQRSDFVLWNDGSVEFLQTQVALLADRLRAGRH